MMVQVVEACLQYTTMVQVVEACLHNPFVVASIQSKCGFGSGVSVHLIADSRMGQYQYRHRQELPWSLQVSGVCSITSSSWSGFQDTRHYAYISTWRYWSFWPSCAINFDFYHSSYLLHLHEWSLAPIETASCRKACWCTAYLLCVCHEIVVFQTL
jgi:hypothetical protein